VLRESLGLLEHAAALFGRIQEHGHTRHVCLACNRALPPDAMPVFDAHIAASLQRSQPERIAALQRDLDAWTQQQADLRSAQALEKQRIEQQADYQDAQAHMHKLEHAQKHAQRARDEAHVASVEAQRRWDAARALQDEAQRIADLALDVASIEQRLHALPAAAVAATDLSPARLESLTQDMYVRRLTKTMVPSAARGAFGCAGSASRCVCRSRARGTCT